MFHTYKVGPVINYWKNESTQSGQDDKKTANINTDHSNVWEFCPFALTPNLFSFAFSVRSKPKFREFTCEISCGPNQRRGVLGLDKRKHG